MILYPVGYYSMMVTLDALYARHAPHMHPTYAANLFEYLEHKNGLLGIGGGWRAGGAQPDLPGFAEEGKSFHQDQVFKSGIVGYAAVDLVAINTSSLIKRVFSLNGTPSNPDATTLDRLMAIDNRHRAPTWAETADAPAFGLHTFIKSPTPEPWHMQPSNIRGWQSWVNAGRQDPIVVLPVPQPVPEVKKVMYFRIKETVDAGQPAPIWGTDNQRTAFWVTAEMYSAAPFDVGVSAPLRSRNELRSMSFPGGLSVDCVR
jgi:hypothetical protein